MSFDLFIEDDQLVEGGGGEELNAGEIQQQVFAGFFFHEAKQLVAQLLDVGRINDLAVEKANHRHIARAAGQIGDFDTTMNSHTKNSSRTAAKGEAKGSDAAFAALNSLPNLRAVCNSSRTRRRTR